MASRQLCLVAVCTIGNALLAPTVPGCSLTKCRAKSGGLQKAGGHGGVGGDAAKRAEKADLKASRALFGSDPPLTRRLPRLPPSPLLKRPSSLLGRLERGFIVHTTLLC